MINISKTQMLAASQIIQLIPVISILAVGEKVDEKFDEREEQDYGCIALKER